MAQRGPIWGTAVKIVTQISQLFILYLGKQITYINSTTDVNMYNMPKDAWDTFWINFWKVHFPGGGPLSGRLECREN